MLVTKLTALLLLVPALTAQAPIEGGYTLGPILHDTLIDSTRAVQHQDVPGHINRIDIQADLVPDFHMIWTNPSLTARTVRLVLDYDVWHDPQPNISPLHNLASVVPPVVPAPPPVYLGRLLHQEGPWFVVPSGAQVYLKLDTPYAAAYMVAGIPPGFDNPSILLGNLGALPVWVEEQNVGPVSDGTFLWVYAEITVGAAPCLGCPPVGTPAEYGFVWTPVVPAQLDECGRNGWVQIGGIPGFVWAQAWDLDVVGPLDVPAMWVEAYSQQLTQMTTPFCTAPPWRRCLDTLTTVGPGTGYAVTQPLITDAMPGDVRYFQLWYRDGSGGFLTTDCMEVSF